jgi:hypothetical protein
MPGVNLPGAIHSGHYLVPSELQITRAVRPLQDAGLELDGT